MEYQHLHSIIIFRKCKKLVGEMETVANDVVDVIQDGREGEKEDEDLEFEV